MNNCRHPPKDHSQIRDNYLYCEVCKVVCNHHISPRHAKEPFIGKSRKRTIFCRAGHDTKPKEIIFDNNNNPSCKLHPGKTWRWKVVSVRGK